MTYFNKNHSSYFTTKDNTRIFYTTNKSHEDLDKKNLLVFNYGLVCSTLHWKTILPLLENQNYSMLVHDYRGHFNSTGDDPIEQCTFKNVSQDIHELLEYLNIEKAIMIGHSMGVNVTLEYAKNYLPRAKGLVLISGSVLPPHDVMFETNLTNLSVYYLQTCLNRFPKVIHTLWNYSYMIPFVKTLVHKGGFQVDQVDMDFIHHYLKKISELSPELFIQYISEMKNHDISRFLHNITCPSLVIGGDSDKVIPNYLQNIL